MKAILIDNEYYALQGFKMDEIDYNIINFNKCVEKCNSIDEKNVKTYI